MNRGTWIAMAGAALLGACNQGPAAPEKTVQQLMAEDVQPTAKTFWDAVRFESVLEDGKPVDRDIVPETDEDWARTKAAAAQLAELGELLKTPGYSEGRNEDWITFSNSLIEVAKLAEQAADERDVDKIFEIGGTIYSVCSACHQVYPATTGPEAEEAGQAA